MLNPATHDLTPENLLDRVKNIHDGVAENDKATRERLNSLEPTHGRFPLSPEELDAYRPKNTVSTVNEAKALVYKCGLTVLEPFFVRFFALEAKVIEQQAEINALRNSQ